MDRRQFITTTAAAATTAIGASRAMGHPREGWQFAGADAEAASRGSEVKRGGAARMHVGCQRWSGAAQLPLLARCGVEAVCATPPGRDEKTGEWSAETCRRRIAEVEKFGVKVGAFYWGLQPDALIPDRRDGHIDSLCRRIEAAGEAGVPCLAYNLHTRIWRARTGKETGRGGALYSVFDRSEIETQKSRRDIGPLTEAELWKRIEYFLKKVVPVAARAKVKLACHPNDPPMPGKHRWHTAQVLDSVDRLKRFVQTEDSPYHGLTFCQGSVWEMLEEDEKPDALYDAIKWFGSRGRIHQVHFRNLRGTRDRFAETFHDNGEIDMIAAAKAYADVGYTGMLMPDHVPGVPADPEDKDVGDGYDHWAFAYGYIKACIQAAYA